MELGSDTIAGLDRHLDALQSKAEQRLLDQVPLFLALPERCMGT